MRSTFALMRASWLAARSYRLRLAISIVSLLASAVPIYFVANALQDTMADKIAGEGGQYFAFVILGMVAFLLLPTAINGMAGSVGGGINTGVFEALLGTRSRLPALLAGMIGFDLCWAGLRAGILLIGATVLGASILWSQLGSAVLILFLIVLAYLPFGMIGSAMVIAFRTAGPLPQAVMTLSALLGGVYYPTRVIPSWLETLSAFVPLTYGLRALRGTMLEGMSLRAVLPDLAMLCLFIAVLMGAGWLLLQQALRYARRTGTLSHY
jgi:ABC-2 type transport system permease protein